MIKGSHKLGRVNHGFAGEQVGADMVMVNNALKTMELVYCELHQAMLWYFTAIFCIAQRPIHLTIQDGLLISCYCSQSNLAYNETSTSWKVPVSIVPDEAILEWEAESLSNADFLKKKMILR